MVLILIITIFFSIKHSTKKIKKKNQWPLEICKQTYLNKVSSSLKTTYLICFSCLFSTISCQTFCKMTSVLAQCPWSVFSTFVLIVGIVESVENLFQMKTLAIKVFLLFITLLFLFNYFKLISIEIEIEIDAIEFNLIGKKRNEFKSMC